jgi:hypothetical protein
VYDHFSKFVWIRPVRKANAKTISKFLLEIFVENGKPESLVCDNAKYFKSKVFQELAEANGIDLMFVSPYHPSSNAAERPNRTIKQLLRIAVGTNNHRKWPDSIEGILIAMRTAINESTNFSPFLLYKGYNFDLPFDAMINSIVKPNPDSIAPDYSKFVSNRASQTANNFLAATQNIAKMQKKNCKEYNKHRTDRTFQVGDLVLLKSHVLSDKFKGIQAGLSPLYEDEIYKINIVYNKLTYGLISLNGKNKGWHHIYNLRHYKARDEANLAQKKPKPKEKVKIQANEPSKPKKDVPSANTNSKTRLNLSKISVSAFCSRPRSRSPIRGKLRARGSIPPFGPGVRQKVDPLVPLLGCPIDLSARFPSHGLPPFPRSSRKRVAKQSVGETSSKVCRNAASPVDTLVVVDPQASIVDATTKVAVDQLREMTPQVDTSQGGVDQRQDAVRNVNVLALSHYLQQANEASSNHETACLTKEEIQFLGQLLEFTNSVDLVPLLSSMPLVRSVTFAVKEKIWHDSLKPNMPVLAPHKRRPLRGPICPGCRFRNGHGRRSCYRCKGCLRSQVIRRADIAATGVSTKSIGGRSDVAVTGGSRVEWRTSGHQPLDIVNTI